MARTPRTVLQALPVLDEGLTRLGFGTVIRSAALSGSNYTYREAVVPGGTAVVRWVYWVDDERGALLVFDRAGGNVVCAVNVSGTTPIAVVIGAARTLLAGFSA